MSPLQSMKFSIRDLFLVTVIVALVLGWWVDHRRQAAESERLKTPGIVIRGSM